MFKTQMTDSTFETADFYLACYLKAKGYQLLDLASEGNRRVFVFSDEPGRKDVVLSFYNNRGEVIANNLVTAIKDMKAMLYNA